MQLLTADIIERFYAFLWPMLRMSGLMIVAPIFALNAFNVRMRILFALVLTWLIFPLYTWPRIDPVSAAGLREIVNQLMIGITSGLCLQVIVAALVVAGQAIATAMGLSMASMIDPNLGNVPVVSQFLILLGSLVFVSSGGHAILLGLMLESFNTLPVGTSLLTQDTLGLFVRWSAMALLGAVLIALPVMISLLFIKIGLGVVTRAAPSLNIFAVGFPALLIAGFLVLIVFLGSIVGRIEWLWVSGFDIVRDVLGIRRG